MFNSFKLSALLLIIAAGFAVVTNASSVNIPKIGNDTSTRFSAEEERILGETFMRQVRLELPVTEDPEVSDYIQRLGFKLISSSEFQTRHFNFFVINDPAINAFAGPNGHIGINAGLILNSEDESEVASVVAHEIAHVTQRHLERSFDKGEKLTLPTAAAIIAALVLGSQDINIAEAAILTTIAANYQTQLSFSRAHELEADHIGMQILIDSGYNPHSMPSFFEKLQKANRLNEGQMLEFLSTHPVTVKRIAESRNRAEQFSGSAPASSQEYHLTKAKLRVNTSENPKKLQANIEAELAEGNYTNRVAELYAYAWVLLLNEKFELARKTTQQLINLDRERIQYSILRGKIEIDSGNTDKGLAIFEEALDVSPGNRALTLYYADSLVRHNKPELALNILDSVNQNETTPAYFQIRAKAAGDSQNSVLAHKMLAEYYLMYDQVGTALDHLDKARSQKNISKRDKESIEIRIEEIKRIAEISRQF